VRFTAFTDYSLRVLLYLAADPTQRATIARIADAFAISENHLVKVVHFLGKQGWLRNVRGKGGGLELALPPARIGIGAVVRQTEGPAVVAACFGDEANGCCLASCCQLQGVLGESVAALYAALDRHTLEDVASNRAQLAPLLFFPERARRAAAAAP